MRGLLVGLLIVIAGALIVIAAWGSWRTASEPRVGLTTPVVRDALVVQATDAARQSSWPCDTSQLPDPGWSCIVVQMLLQNQGGGVRGYDPHQFRLEDQTGYRYPRHLPAYYFPAVGLVPLGQGSLAPGAQVQGTLWFAAPRGRGSFNLVYQAPQDGAGPIRVLLPEPLRAWR
jgi:hypothetical protein